MESDDEQLEDRDPAESEKEEPDSQLPARGADLCENEGLDSDSSETKDPRDSEMDDDAKESELGKPESWDA